MNINFFSLREKVTKRGKNLAGLSPCHFCFFWKLLSPPRAPILFLTNKIYSEPRRIFTVCRFFLYVKCPAPIIKSLRAYSAFADHNESVNHFLASWFRRIFVRYEQKSRAGRGALFRALIGTDKAIKRHVFSLLLLRFSFEQRKA